MGTVYDNKEWLHNEYVVKRKTANQIANEIGVSDDAVTRAMKRNGVELRTPTERLSGIKKSDECKKKLSNAKMGRGWTKKQRDAEEEYYKNNHGHLYGKHLTTETKEKLREANIGKKQTKETIEKIRNATKGENNPMYGRRGENSPLHGRKRIDQSNWMKKNNPMKNETSRKKLSENASSRKRTPEMKEEIRKKTTGENHWNWKGGISFEPYCNKFNNAIKEEIRERFNRTCVLCGEHEYENAKLCVHHADYNKGQGCGKKWSLIPMHKKCHAKTNYNRWYWFNLLNNYWATSYMGEFE